MKPEGMNDGYKGFFGLDGSPNNIKVFSWFVCLILATTLAIFGNYYAYSVASTPFRTYFMWLSIISPICIGIAALRLVGVRWRYAILLFIFVPVLLFARVLAFGILYGLMGD